MKVFPPLTEGVETPFRMRASHWPHLSHLWFSEKKKSWARSKDWPAEDRCQCEKNVGQTSRTIIYLWTSKYIKVIM